MATDLYVHELVEGRPGGPLLFVFHGTGGDEHQFPGLARQLLPSATVVSPRGDVSEQGSARFFRRTGEGVYDMADLARATQKMAGFVAARREDRDAAAVLGLGYSNGANILASVLFDRPELFDGAVLMHPLIPFEPRIDAAAAGRQVLITAGRRDPICPAPMTERLRHALSGAGMEVAAHWHEGGHELRQEELTAAREFLAQWESRG